MAVLPLSNLLSSAPGHWKLPWPRLILPRDPAVATGIAERAVIGMGPVVMGTALVVMGTALVVMGAAVVIGAAAMVTGGADVVMGAA